MVCSKCKEGKKRKDFHKQRQNANGLYPYCKRCVQKIGKEYQSRPEVIKRRKEWAVEWAKKNKDKLRENNRKCREKNKGNKEYEEKRLEYMREYRQKNKKRIATYKLKYRQENKERIREYDREYSKKYYPKNKAYYSLYSNNRFKRLRATNPKFRLDRNFSNGVFHSLKDGKNERSWESLVGYTVSDLMKHLEKQFKEGMTWENYGRGGWHLDHILPISVFNYTSYEHIDFYRCWSLNNLQPLWEKENIIKSNKIEKHFQPCLLLK